LTEEIVTQAELQSLADSVGFWFHSIDLGQGVITKGLKTESELATEFQKLQLPNLSGKTVLDIGSFDGYFAFAAERAGARHVVAMDYYTWSLDLPKHIAFWRECKDRGVDPNDYEKTEHWRPDELPGKRGFDLAHKAKGSRVEPKVADFMATDLDALGRYDVVLFLGVLYHLKHPLLALERLAQVTREVAVIETEAILVPGREHLALCEFYETNELNGDTSNWWAPNAKALVGMCRTAGFREVKLSLNEKPDNAHWARAKRTAKKIVRRDFRRGVRYYRLIARAYK
jgi:tRNA (mo5U34)-methyltransferase